MRRSLFIACGLVLILCLAGIFTGCQFEPVDSAIVTAGTDSTLEGLAAQEIRRYIYLRSGKMFTISNRSRDIEAPALVILATVGTREGDGVIERFGLTDVAEGLLAEHYCLRSFNQEGQKKVLILGGSPLGTLYGSYRFAEHLGIRFYLHGDVIPDEQVADLQLPDLDEIGRPLFEHRGIQPFHDFPEGPDWWNVDQYKAILSQLPKMRMNFLGLHTYPEGRVGPEPTVWIGLEEDADREGKVSHSYPSRHFTTRNVTGAWGYQPAKTSDYYFGAADLFDKDDFAADYMEGTYPWNQMDMDQSNRLFNRFGELLRNTFTMARILGIKTCIGTETPLIIPQKVKDRLHQRGLNPDSPETVGALYRGIFSRIKKTHPLDFYWFWTPENWTWSEVEDQAVEKTIADLQIAIEAAEEVEAPFTLATCGWVLGPPGNRAYFDQILPEEMPMSCINRNVGHDPVEPGFAKIQGRPKWAIPWLEDDPAQIIPQLWVGRMRRDAADALSFGCTGLLGIHWRTRVLGPNVSALSQAAWDQNPWAENLEIPARVDFTRESENRRQQFEPSRHAPQEDFYRDWAAHQFGPKTGNQIGGIFSRLDGRLPRPSTWFWGGPGGLKPDPRPWEEVEKEYGFIDELEKIRGRIRGAGYGERFDYWLNSFRYLREVGRVNCVWARYNAAWETVKGVQSKVEQKRLARETALPIRIELVAAVDRANQFLYETVTTTGGLGNITNWQQHILPNLLKEPGNELEVMLGESLPTEANPSLQKLNQGSPRLIVPTIRSSLQRGENLKIRVIVAGAVAEDILVFWKPLGGDQYESFPLENSNRAVFEGQFPEETVSEDFEYFIRSMTTDKRSLYFPVTAPDLNQTVVVFRVNGG